MPEMDGSDVSAALRADEELRLIPLLFLTSIATSGDLNRMRKQLAGRRAVSKDAHLVQLIDAHRGAAEGRVAAWLRFATIAGNMPTRYGNKIEGARLRLVLKRGVAFGPGKADLLEHIRESGSIAAAGRTLGCSYTRAWHLVEAMNREFRAPLVERSKGGAARGGASLTPLGIEVLERYRRLDAAAQRAVARELGALRRLLS